MLDTDNYTRFQEIIFALNTIKCEMDALDRSVLELLRCRRTNNNVFFIGNGGSSAIASHMAADFGKNGRMKAMAFNDAASLTCRANDLGYEQVFADPLGLHGGVWDVLVAISSSGRSLSILNAVWQAKKIGMYVITLSGFTEDNPLRLEGMLNFYVNSHKYGIVEVVHHAILHSVLDQLLDDGNS